MIKWGWYLLVWCYMLIDSEQSFIVVQSLCCFHLSIRGVYGEYKGDYLQLEVSRVGIFALVFMIGKGKRTPIIWILFNIIINKEFVEGQGSMMDNLKEFVYEDIVKRKNKHS